MEYYSEIRLCTIVTYVLLADTLCCCFVLTVKHITQVASEQQPTKN